MLLLATVALGVRVSRLAVILDARGVLVRNVFRDYRLAWEDIAAVRPPAEYGAWRDTGVCIERKDGGYVSASAFSLGPLDDDELGQPLVRAIRERLNN